MEYVLPYMVRIRDQQFLVRPSREQEDGNWTLEFGEQRVPIDLPDDLLGVAAGQESVFCEFGPFTLELRRGPDGRPLYRAHAQGACGQEDRDEERACWSLLDVLGDEKAPRACFFCRWSDVEPSTGWGHLGCALAHAKTYHEVATSNDPMRRKYSASSLLDWVAEWHCCAHFEVRPFGYGYRGRPRPASQIPEP